VDGVHVHVQHAGAESCARLGEGAAAGDLPFRVSGKRCTGQHTLGRCCGTYERKHSAAVFEHWHCQLLGASRCCAIARGKGLVAGMEPLGKLSMVTQPEPDKRPVLVAIEYRVDPEKVPEFLDALHDYQRIRRRDGAMRWGVYYDAENPGVYLENFVVESWAEHTRQHDRFTVADRKFEERVLSLVLESPKTRHFPYPNRVERVSPVHKTK